jgi:hypothetical protein
MQEADQGKLFCPVLNQQETREMYRSIIGFEELKEELHQFIRDELANQLQARSGRLNEDRITTGTS